MFIDFESRQVVLELKEYLKLQKGENGRFVLDGVPKNRFFSIKVLI